MPMPPVHIQGYLTPDTKPAAPEGFAQVDETITAGLPHRIELTQESALIVVVPTGVATLWRDSDPLAVVSQSDPDLAPFDVKAVAGPLVPARLIVQRSGAPFASLLLAAGLRRLVTDSGQNLDGARLEFVILSWEIHAGSLRGPGDFGSRISLAWRNADSAAPHFQTPPSHPLLLDRLPRRLRMESLLGLTEFVQLERFKFKKVLDDEFITSIT
jgi:hypothetical protein